MSEPAAEYEGEYEGGRPLGLYILVGVIVALVAVSGLFAVGFIPPVAKIGAHGTSGITTTGSGAIQFLTVTSTIPGTTTTVSVPGQNTTLTTSTVLTTTQTSTSTSTQTSTQTLTSVSTSTSVTTVLQPTTTTTTTTVTNSATTTVGPGGPLSVNFTLSAAGDPVSLDAGDYFTVDVSINNTQANTQSFITAYQLPQGDQPQVLSFYPSVPETVLPVVGTSSYVLQGGVSPNAPSGEYQMFVQVSSVLTNSTATVQTTISRQYIVRVLEPLNFITYAFPNPSSQFEGTCANTPFINGSVPTWGYQCQITAAPEATANMTFTVSNAANVPICIQTSLGGGSIAGFVNINPYPFCPNGETGVLVPAGAVYTFVYTLTNAGQSAGAQSVFFTFQRET
ncbi:MAG: hypothetical protein ACRD6W_12850 [Nitrososphaerales archaeon]